MSTGRGISAAAAVGWLALALALACALAAVLSGFGHRWGWWSFPTGFAVLRWSVYAALGAATLSAIGLLLAFSTGRWRRLPVPLLALVLAAATVALPWGHLREARQLPPIHDVTTDTEDPPAFVDILPLRAAAPNSADYGGPDVAEMQRRAYPEIGPVILEQPPAETFERALALAGERGWEVVAAVPEEGRIEATDETFWFGFKDDVVIRIRPHPDGSQVDVRSVSRVGRGDLGTNAQRIRAFLDALAARAPPAS